MPSHTNLNLRERFRERFQTKSWRSSAAASSPPQTTSNASSSHNLIDDALKRLSDRDRVIIRKHILPTSSDIDVALKKALAAAKEKQRLCDENKWTFTFAGQALTSKDEADKVVHWLNRLRAVGNGFLGIDPVHAGLPWTGICLLLEAAISEANQMNCLLVGCETVLYAANRLKAYMDFLDGLPATLTRTDLESAITKLCAHILRFIARALQVYQTPSFKRVLRAFWQDSDVQKFEQECDKLGRNVEIAASNCDRTLNAQDRDCTKRLKQDLQKVLEELSKCHKIQDSLGRIEVKIDLNALPYAGGVVFNPDEDDHPICHQATRVDLLHQIQDWAQRSESTSILWLNGTAGTGKTTISRTIAEWLTGQGCLGVVDLGASFFFKRGEGDRGSASRFFSTVCRELVLKIPGLDTRVAEAITSDPSVCDKSLGEQFDKLIYQPLLTLDITTSRCSTFIVVVDALDECENARDIKVILGLWSRLTHISTVCLKLFLTSRPDLPVQLAFSNMSVNAHYDLIILDEVPRTTSQHDISIFLKDEFSKIRKRYNDRPPSRAKLNPDWPGDKVIWALVDMAVPLFIVAATVCRFVGDHNFIPEQRLEEILRFQKMDQLGQLERTYLPVLTQLPATLSNTGDKERFYQEFQMIVGSIFTLADALSVTSLAALLDVARDTIVVRLRPLYSILRVPADPETPVRTLHLSVGEFLLNQKFQHQPFGANGPATHRLLLTKCLELLSGPGVLRENLCDLKYPGQPRREVDATIINERLSPAFQYACRYWVHHVQHSMVPIYDDGDVHVFLQEHFLHWVEALSLMNRIVEVARQLRVLQKLVSATSSTHISSFLEDARRIFLANRYIADIAPLQIYSSAMVFAPQTSLVKKICSQVPAWLRRYPNTPLTWSLELMKLEGHTGSTNAVAFSQDGWLLASGSWDQTIRLWDPTTGQEVQKMEGHTSKVNAVVFSQDDSLLASGSHDRTIRLWDPTTGQEVRKLEGHTSDVHSVRFSQDGSLLASGSRDQTVRLWDPATGQEVRKLEGHIHSVEAVTFSPDGSLLVSGSRDQTIRLWDTATGHEVRKLEGHIDPVEAVAFSPDGSLLASGSWDRMIWLWDSTTGQKVRKLEGHTNPVSAVAFSPDGSLLASGSWDQSIRLWDPTTGQEVRKLEGRHHNSVSAVAFSQDGLLLASGSWDQTIRLWDLTTGQEVRKPEGHTHSVESVVFSPDGSLLASGSRDQTIRLWDPTTGQHVRKLEGHAFSVSTVAFSQDGSLLASGSSDRTIRLWDLTTGQEVRKLEGHNRCVNAVAFSQDGSLLASGSLSQTIILWDWTTGQEVRKLEGHTNSVRAVAFSQDGLLLASGSHDRTIRLWDLATGQEVRKLKGHTNTVNVVTFSQDDLLLASGSWDQTIRLWNPSTGQAVQTVENISSINAISFTTDNKILTNRGIISLDEDFISGKTLESSSKSARAKDDWIQQRNRNFLWLPDGYRGSCSAYCGDTYVIGHGSGQISFFQLDHT
ncbi:hypothetical protein MMC07_001412 [Pseudocyphellaria aurata]|nr:hypothetical protein [Pseudocyphellaria aurata]